MTIAFIESPHAADRFTAACDFLRAENAAGELVVVGASIEATSALVRSAQRAVFGWHRLTLGALAARLATTRLARRALVGAPPLSIEAVCTRVIARLSAAGKLGRFEAVADRPGLARALATTVLELGQAGIAPHELAARPNAADLARLFDAYQAELTRLGLSDRAALFAEAVSVAREPSHQFRQIPLLFYDVRITCKLEADLVEALTRDATNVLATLPSGDAGSRRYLEGALRVAATRHARSPATSLERLQANLFEATSESSLLDESVTILSAPGESRESVEIARRILAEAERGVRFDRMAILLRAPEQYRVHLETALARARIPGYFSKGAVRPEPSGRAMLALIACAAEGLSARRFAEYLSLGVVPPATESGAPPPDLPPGDRFVRPDDELSPVGVLATETADQAATPAEANVVKGSELTSSEPAISDGTLRAPRRWEKLLVDASVIGGRDRWARRLQGLDAELRAAHAELARADEPRAAAVERDIAHLESLRKFALPLIDDIAALPQEASWAEWLDALTALATRALRDPGPVLRALAELNPLAPVGPVTLSEVRVVLEARLGDLRIPPTGSPMGKVWVGSAEEARGLVFDVVFVPGLAERMFPKKVLEDPLLLDAERSAISPSLATKDDRIAHERVALRIASGAARERLVLSYPRVDTNEGRPRVPSFYGLEALRAAEGTLPGFDDLVRRADKGAAGRMGWPAPADPRQAIDAIEYDLVMLDRFLRKTGDEAHGAAHYLLHANPHLARALRFRGRRWKPSKWFSTDGIVEPSSAASAALDRHRISARPYSATALERYALCPYRFYLGAIVGLAPREPIERIDEMNAAQRGQLIHELQRTLLSELRDARLLPVTAAHLQDCLDRLERVVDRLSADWHDRLSPAIERVWEDAVSSIRADLREWLSAMVDSGWVPTHFELGFGLPPDATRDPASRAEPVELECGLRLRGAIDLVEEQHETVRATDHKTGRHVVPDGFLIGKGSVLQPVLYALALEKMLPARIGSGRLYYCTVDAGFTSREVPLDDAAREAAGRLAHTIDTAIAERFLPAAPADGACEYCDYRVVCGPYESQRTARKPRRELEPLVRLRNER